MAMDGHDVPSIALVWTVLIISVSRVLVLEDAIGRFGGDAETREPVDSYLRRLEGEPRPTAGISSVPPVHHVRNEQSTPLCPSLDFTTLPSTTRSQ